MFSFFKKKIDKSTNNGNDSLKEDKNKDSIKIASGFAVAESARQSTEKAAAYYAKPESYTGNRHMYDSGIAKKMQRQSCLIVERM